MAYTVWGAFQKFREDTVDVLTYQSDNARASRDWLVDQLVGISNKDFTFPKLTGKYVKFGSFARKTKVRPLDDNDLMVILNGAGTSLYKSDKVAPYEYWLRIDSETAPLARFPDEYNFVNSTKILRAYL